MAVSAKNFRFISPGIRIEEIDRSQIPADEPAIGACVIGRAARGPAFTPVEVRSFSDFVATFGEPVAGGQGGDVWREGNYTSPMYATYAAQSWLRNGEALTFMRTLGVASDDATTTGKAGWQVGEITSASNGTGEGGAYGLLVWESGSGAGGAAYQTGTLAAVWYLETGSIQLSGNFVDTPASSGLKTSTLISSDANGQFTAQFQGTGNTSEPLPTSKFKFSLQKSSSVFARKVFNTNPTLLGRQSANDPVGYFLGETFENSLVKGDGTAIDAGGDLWGMIVGLGASGKSASDFRIGALDQDNSVPRSGWVISQDQSNDTASFSSDMTANINSGRVEKLFRLVGLNSGQWIQENLKMSIENIRPPVDANVDPYYRFNVVLRRLGDTDTSKQIVESFTDCTLNKNDDDYLLRKIGTKYVTYDEATNRNIENGEYDNRSEYVRVEVNSKYADGFEATLIPYGVTGPTRYKPHDIASSVTLPGGGNRFLLVGNEMNGNTAIAAVVAEVPAGGLLCTFPAPKTRATANLATVGAYRVANFGVSVRDDGANLVREDVIDLSRIKPAGISGQYDSGSYLDYSFITTLDNVKYSGATNSLPGTSSVLVYANDARSGGASLSAKSGSNEILELSTGAPGLTTLFFGGTDGFDITVSDPLAPGQIAVNNKENSYEYFTLERAINTVKNPEEVSYNVIAVPGMNNSSLNSKLVANTEERADALAVIEYEGSYVPPADYRYSTNSSTNGNVNTYITNRKSDGTNSSYAATYFPWVKVRDNINSTDLWVPASVAALGAMSYTDRVQAPWFAPAGFNRGGLSSGVSGLPVVSTALKLFKDDRDDLYEVGVNPIATFPNEGVVIFGQKTLQIQRSALDRINVRRLLVFLKRGISRISNGVLFEPNVPDTWNNFKNQAIPFLTDVKTRFGLTDYKLVLDETTTTPDLIDQNILYAKLFIKPARAIEYIALDFIITNTGASFDD